MSHPVPDAQSLRAHARDAKMWVGISAGVGVFTWTSLLAVFLGYADMGDPEARGLLSLLTLGSILVLVSSTLAAAMNFIDWQRSAYDNATTRGTEFSFSRGMASAAWFIPFVNLVLPFRHMSELGRATSKTAPAAATRSRALRLWWAFLVGAILLTTLGVRYDVSETVLTSSVALLHVAAALALFRVVDGITDGITGVEGPIEF